MITSLKNPKVKLIQALQSTRRAREREGLFVMEGRRLLEEIVRVAARPLLVLHHDNLSERDRGLVNRLASLSGNVDAVTDEVISACSATEAPAGLLAVLPFPNLSLPKTPSLILICDGVRDPGNYGAILRTAEAAGVELVYAPPGTVDVYNPKVVRGGAGAHLRLPIYSIDWEALRAQTKGFVNWLASSASGSAYFDVDWTVPSALIVSSEAAGESEQARELVTGSVHIPMARATESLNVAVAAGILLMEARRQRLAVG